MYRLTFFVGWFALIEVVSSQGKAPLSVERIFNSPSLSGVSVSSVQWNPDGHSVAYLRIGPNEDERSLWMFDLESGRSVKVVGAQDILGGDERISAEEIMVRERTRQSGGGISRYFFSPDGKTLYVPIDGDVFAVDVVTKNVRPIIKTPHDEFDPRLSPDGRAIAFVRNGDIYVLDIDSGKETRLTSSASDKVRNGVSEYVAQEEMGRTTGYWWSPDSKRIAFLSIDNSPVREFHVSNVLIPYSPTVLQTYPKAGEANTIVSVHVVSSAGGTPLTLDLGANSDIYIPRVHWFPDGSAVWVQIQSRNQDTVDMLSFDANSGKKRSILRETDQRWVGLHDDFHFVEKGREFIWSSERDGYRHLYLYDASGKLVRQLTRGEWEVEGLVSVDEKGGRVFFLASRPNPMERNLYGVSLTGSDLKRHSPSSGRHDATMGPDKNQYVDVFSSTTRPPLMALMTIDHEDARMIEENRVGELEAVDLPAPEFVSVSAANGVLLNGSIIKPSTFDPSRRYPLIMYVYGGPTSQVVMNQWGAGGGAPRALWHRMMAARGYIVFSVDGRGTSGRGRQFQNEIHRTLGEVELQDQLTGLRYAKSLGFVDTTRMMIWGKSYGGYMTCLAMLKSPGAFKLGIAVAPVTDWKNYDTHYTERYMERPQENPDGYRQSSPLHFAHQLQGRFLLIHGMQDDNVHAQDAMLLAHALQMANKQFDMMIYPGSTHSFSGRNVGIHLYSLLTDYISRNL